MSRTPGQWYAIWDGFPRGMWTIRNRETGDTLKAETAPGWYRTSSENKAERDAAKLNKETP